MKNQLERINDFIDSIEQRNPDLDLSKGLIMGSFNNPGNDIMVTVNSKNCTNETDACKASTNKNNCTNRGFCTDTTNEKACQNLSLPGILNDKVNCN